LGRDLHLLPDEQPSPSVQYRPIRHCDCISTTATDDIHDAANPTYGILEMLWLLNK